MATVVVEIFHLTHFHKKHESFNGTIVTIGRGYHNDLILDDLYVSEEHLILRAHGTGWFVEDVGSENGLYLKKTGQYVQSAYIESGDEIIIGKTHLRIFSPTHQVAPTKSLHHAKQPEHESEPKSLLSAWSLVPLVFLVYTLQAYCKTVKIVPFAQLIIGAAIVLFVIAISAGLWALVGRLIKHKAHYSVQLVWVAWFFLLFPIINTITEYIGFYSSSRFVENGSSLVLYGIVFIVVLTKHLGIATYISKKFRIVVSVFIVCAIITTGTLGYFALKDMLGQLPIYYSTVKPPIIKLSLGKPIEIFLADAQRVFDIGSKNR